MVPYFSFISALISSIPLTEPDGLLYDNKQFHFNVNLNILDSVNWPAGNAKKVEFFKEYKDKEDLRKQAYDYALQNYKNKKTSSSEDVFLLKTQHNMHCVAFLKERKTQ